jgi:FkbM family methyltransferase
MAELESRRGHPVDAGLVFDLGMHRGEDTAYYLAKGFRVVAVEADDELCAEARARFGDAIAAGQLVVENVAICRDAAATFYASTNDQWGTACDEWVRRNSALGARVTRTFTVPGVSLRDLLDLHGCPHYLKVDLEGADHLALSSLHCSPYRPDFISVESDKNSWAALTWEIETFRAMGYTRFQAVPQHTVERQLVPTPAREGRSISHRFPWSGSSGAFGLDLPPRWMSGDRLLRRYRVIFLRYRFFGDNAIAAPGIRGWLGRALYAALGEAGWWDTHAAHHTVRLDDEQNQHGREAVQA